MENVFSKPAVERRAADGELLFRKDWLKDYIVIDEPGTYEVVTTSAPNFYDPEMYGEEGNPRYIVNVKAVTPANLSKLAEVLTGQEFVKISQTNGLFMNGNVWINEDGEAPVLPGKRELIKVNVNFVTNRAGEEVLGITDITVLPTKKGKKINMNALFAGDDMPK